MKNNFVYYKLSIINYGFTNSYILMTSFIMIPSINLKLPTPDQAIEPQTITAPPPCFTVDDCQIL